LSEIKHAYPLILNKVASPRYATPVLRRGRLLEWLDASANCRATVIAADAGYGKTTLLYQWEREAAFPCYWYKLDRNDRDWTLHISYLIESIRHRHEGFGRRANAILEQLGGPGSSRPGVAAYLLAEMHQRLTDPCTFIIDDWQYVNAATEVRGLWNQILRDAPPTCRFLFASRAKPKLQFARFKTHGGYAELRTDSLRFTESEIAELFRDVYDDPLHPAEIAELERRTEGWAASLQLVEVSLRQRQSAEDRLGFLQSITATRDSDLFEFLAEEVLDQQSEETRNFLLATSILQQMTAEIAQRLAGVHDGERELRDLEQRGLFTSRLDDRRYRYHTLFREFLERRLISERSDAEVVGLHIHAASYFETTHQWPEAIHHYLRAGLHRQAARLIAKFGEEVVSDGRLGLVDTWLRDLPTELIRQNARLSLLQGEALGIAGEWESALTALKRAREYFARKGDRRLEALACLKLSTVYSNHGDAESAAATAEAGLRLLPPGDSSTRLRLEGNLAVTRTWLTGSLAKVVQECQRVADTAAATGYEHFAAIGYYNVGEMQLRMGDVAAAVSNMERAAQFWAEMPTSPFGHNEDLAEALVISGQPERARTIAEDAVRRTTPWARPKAFALYGQAGVLQAEGHLAEAIAAMRQATSDANALGAGHTVLFARLVELLFLAERPRDEIRDAGDALQNGPDDPRYAAEIAPALAVLDHVARDCMGECQERLSVLDAAEQSGARLLSLIGRVKVGALALDHRSGSRAKRSAWMALAASHRANVLAPIRLWARRFSVHAKYALEVRDGVDLLMALVNWDPDGWRSSLVGVLGLVAPSERHDALQTLVRNAGPQTVDELESIGGRDVERVRQQLRQARASRLYLRTFGAISLRRDGWSGQPILVEKRRVRALLAVLGAHAHTTLTRDMAIDLLWPDADGDAAVNSLNQTVFQLRRYLDPDYRQGESPEYVLSSSERVFLNPDLVMTDLELIRSLPTRLVSASWPERQAAATSVIELIDGEFLADLRYESWASRIQLTVQNEVRSKLMPIATGDGFDVETALAAAAALVTMDPYDETATLALADCLARTGRRVAAKDLLRRYRDQLARDLGDEPSPELSAAARGL
jgi:ATP/maltotriose-dependent transcriptional regulator MalT/DNA-binding SARP family transcriptional activator